MTNINRHKVFITEEDLKQSERKKLETKALALWMNHSQEYKSLPFDYHACLQEKRERKLRLHKLPVAVEDYPNLPLLMFAERWELEKYVHGLPMRQLTKIVENTEDVLQHDYAICSLREWVKDAKFIIKQYDEEQQRKSSSAQKTQPTWP